MHFSLSLLLSFDCDNNPFPACPCTQRPIAMILQHIIDKFEAELKVPDEDLEA